MHQQRYRQLVIALSLAVCLFYLTYRLLFTLNLTTVYAGCISVFLLLGEAYGVFVMVLFYLQVWDSREPPQQPVLEGRTVDVFVPTYNEDPQLLRATIEACSRLDYPHKTYLCDDGGTDARLAHPQNGPAARARAAVLKAMCAELGAIYMPRPDNRHAKAGNLNHAFTKTDGEFIIILDADHVPEPHFITRLVGYFRDEKLGFVQTPHAFYNFNNFQARYDHKNRRYWEEGHLFYEVIQPGRNRWNCPIFAGSAAMFRRKALAEVGYIATETITEDMHTGMRVNSRGWKSLAISQRLVAGQAAPDVTTFHTQRIRWGEGNLSIMAYDNPLTMRGLTPGQRFCYLGSMVHWAGGLFKMAIYLTPILMMFSGVAPVAEFTWFLAALTVLYLIASVQGVNVASNGFGSFFNGELFCMINFWTQVQGTMKALFWRKFQSFVVTSKRGRQAKSVWPYLRPQVYLIAVSLAALVWGWGRLAAGISDDYFKPIIPTFWIVFHVTLALTVLRRALWPEDRRFSARHLVQLPVAYETRDGAKGLAVTADLNEIGVGLITYQPLAVDDVLRLTLWGRGESVECEGVVRNARELTAGGKNGSSPHGYRVGIAFHNLRAEQTDALNRMALHYAVPRLYAEYAEGRERTLWWRMGQWVLTCGMRRRFALRREVHMPLVLDPDGRRGQPIYTVTEDVSRAGLSALLADALPPDTEVDFLLPTPAGEVRGRVREVRKKHRVYAARTYHLCAFEFTDVEGQGRVTLGMVLNPRENPDLDPVLKPEPKPLVVPLKRPALVGLAACLPLLIVTLVAFRVVYRDDFFLRDIARAQRPITEEELARVDAIFARTLKSRYPSNDRLVLLTGALARVNQPREMDQVTMLLAPRDRKNLDLQFALAQTLDNHEDFQRAEAEYARVLQDVERGHLPPRRRKDLLLAAARASVHAGNLDRAGGLFQQLLAADPQEMAYRNEYAGVLMGAGRFAEAARLYDGVEPDLNGRLLLVSIHAQANDLDAAEKEARAIVRLRPDDPQAKLLLADVLSWRKGGYRQSRAIYEQLRRANGDSPDLLLRLAQVSLWSKNYNDALERFQPLVEGRLDNKEVVRGYVDAAASADQLSPVQARTALAIYDHTLTAAADDPVFLSRLAWVLQRLQEPDKSAVLLDRAAALNPQDPGVRRQMFGAFIAAGRWNEALQEFEGKELDYDTRLMVINIHLKGKDFEGAARECRRLVEQKPDDAKALRLLADILSWKKDYKGSLATLKQLAAVAPDAPEVAAREAEVTLWSGDYDGALARYQALLDAHFERHELWPNYAAAAANAKELTAAHRETVLRVCDAAGGVKEGVFLGRLAWVLHRLKEDERAEPLADRAAGLAPKEPGPRKELAGVLAALGRTKPALHLYDGLTLDLDDRYRLAVLHAADKDFAAAAEQCRAILKERPDDRKALRELADVLSWKKDYAESVALFEQLSQADPTDVELRRRLAEVLLWKGDYDQALARFEALLDADFEQPALWPSVVDAAASARALSPKQTALVRRIAEKVAAGECKEVALLTRLAWLEHRLKDAATAGAFLDRALALAPTDAAARRELAGVLAAVGRNKEALHLYEGVTPDAADHVPLAGLYAAEKDFATAEKHCREALKAKPGDRAALRQLADVLTWKKDYAEALPLLRKLAGETPQDHELQVRLAEVTLWSGAAAQALPLFEKLTAADPNNTELQRRLAEAFLWSGDYDRALPRFEALLTANFEQPELWGELVDAASSARALSESQAALARRVAERLPAADCKDAGQATRLAWVLYRVKEPQRAAVFLDRALALAPKEPAARKNLAGVLAAAGRNKDALRLYDGLTLDAADHVRLAGLYAAEKDFVTAETHCRAALKAKPEDRAALRQLADVLSWKKDYAEALPLLRKLSAEAPEDRELRVRLAEVTLWSGAAAQALPLFEKLTAADPNNPELQRRLAEALLWSGDYDRALPRLEALLTANFEQPELWGEFVDAASSARALGEKQAALVRRVAERLPPAACNDAGQATRLAWVLCRVKETERAGAFLDRALALAPKEPAARKELAGVLAAAGRSKDALRMYEGLPVGPEDRARLAGLYAAAKDFGAAEAQCRALLKDRPDDPKVLRQLADVLSWKKDYAGALALFEKLAQANPADAELQRRITEVLLWKGEYDRALARFQTMLEANFDQPTVWRSFVDAAAGTRQLSPAQARLAVRIADGTARGEPKDAIFLARLAWVLHRLKETERAGAIVDRAAAERPADPAARKELAGVLAALGRTKPALHLYEGLTLTLDDRINLASLYAADQDFDAAEAQCRAILKERPDDRKALRQLAAVLTWKKDYVQALALMKQLAQSGTTDAETPLRLAELMLWSGDYDKALERFQGLLETNFEQPELWHSFVDAAASAHEVTAAQKALALRICERTVKAESKDPAFLARLAWLLYRARESAKAIDLLDQAVALKPKEPGVRKELAGTLAAVGKYREALGMYEGLTLDPDDRYHLVGICATAGLKCREALEEDPDDRSARQQLDYVQGWKKTSAESVALLQKLAGDSPDDRQAQVRAAEVTLWSGAHDEALRRFHALLEDRFEQPDLWRPYIDAAASTEATFSTAQARMIGRVYDQRAAVEDRAEYLSRLAWVLYRLKQTAKVEKLLDRALALKPEEPAVRRELAGVLAAAGRHEEARHLYDGLKLTFADRYRLAEIDLAAHRYEAAEKGVNEILQARPDDLRGQLLLAAVLSGTKRYDEAARLYRKLQRANPGDPRIPVKLAELALWGGDYDNALAQFQELLDRDADRPALWPGYADAAASARRLGDKVRPTVVHIYESLKENGSSDATFLTRLAWVLRRVKEADRSIALLEKALALEPGSRATRQQLAEALYEKGDYAGAEKHYQQLLGTPSSRPGGR